MKEVWLNIGEMQQLRELYSDVYGTDVASAASCRALKFARLNLDGEVYGSVYGRTDIYSFVRARFRVKDDAEPNNDVIYDTYPGHVQLFFNHDMNIGGEMRRHVFAFVNWFVKHAHIQRLGEPVEIWHADRFYNSMDKVIPIHRFVGRFVPGFTT